jgi:hypothetical protein
MFTWFCKLVLCGLPFHQRSLVTGAFHRFDELRFSFRDPENAVFHFSTTFLIALSVFRLVAFSHLILSIQAFFRRTPPPDWEEAVERLAEERVLHSRKLIEEIRSSFASGPRAYCAPRITGRKSRFLPCTRPAVGKIRSRNTRIFRNCLPARAFRNSSHCLMKKGTSEFLHW